MNLAPYIDHTNLKPDASAEDIKRLCDEAAACGFASVCVNPCRVSLAAECLKGTSVAVCSVVGFPLGASPSVVKALEAAEAVKEGASEIDMVINIGALKDKDYDAVESDIRAVAEAVPYTAVKVIIEACLLSDEEKVVVCRLAEKAGACFVKTSTGFAAGGAAEADVKLMRASVGSGVKVKAAGGIRDAAAAERMINAGADRLGTSKSLEICGINNS